MVWRPGEGVFAGRDCHDRDIRSSAEETVSACADRRRNGASWRAFIDPSGTATPARCAKFRAGVDQRMWARRPSCAETNRLASARSEDHPSKGVAMRFRLRAGFAALLVAMTLGSMTAAPVAAVTGGDADGNRHPNVGLILFYSPDGRFRCSATLVTPTVLLTAAHCTVDTVGKTLVDFRSVVAEKPPTGYPVAKNVATGYTQAEIEGAGFLSGTAYAHPDYSNF